MKKTLLIVIPIVLVLCVVCGVISYFVWQNANKQIIDIQGQLGISPVIGNTQNVTSTPSDTNTITDGGNTTTPDTNAGTVDACKMLTKEIAQQILGGTLKADQSPNGCTYSTSDAGTGSFGVLTIVVTKLTPATAKVQFDTAKSTVYENKTVPVSGLNAEEAVYAETMKQLSILKGDSWIIISGISDKFSSDKELAVETAKLILK